MLGVNQPVILYYGTEIGMSQEKPFEADEPYADVQARQTMRWDMSDPELFGFVRMLIRSRR